MIPRIGESVESNTAISDSNHWITLDLQFGCVLLMRYTTMSSNATGWVFSNDQSELHKYYRIPLYVFAPDPSCNFLVFLNRSHAFTPLTVEAANQYIHTCCALKGVLISGKIKHAPSFVCLISNTHLLPGAPIGLVHRVQCQQESESVLHKPGYSPRHWRCKKAVVMRDHGHS